MAEDKHKSSLRRLLLVDDDQYVVNFLNLFLSHKGFEVQVAHDGPELERSLGRGKYDVVVMDIRLKDAQGTQLVPLVRERQPGVPVVMLTGLGYDQRLMDEALKAGARGYVSKTLPPEELLAALERAMQATA